MEDGKGACANLAKAAAAFTVLSLLPVALSGSAPSHASAGLLPISWSGQQSGPIDAETPYSSLLFGSFAYDPAHGEARGTYVSFTFTELMGPFRSYVTTGAAASVQYIDSIDVGPFLPMRYPQVLGPTFYVEGLDVEIRAHDDPTGLLEIHTKAPRTVTIELPASATNLSLRATELAWPGSWPASSVSYTIGEAHARFVLGAGSFAISGTQVIAQMASSDLLVFKAIPTSMPDKVEYWRAVLDAITAGQVVAEFDLVATSKGAWVENSARYRIDVAAWPQRVVPGKASVHLNSSAPLGAFVLLAFDPDTMPADATRALHVRANGVDVNVTAATLGLFYAPDSGAPAPAYAVLPLPGTVLAVYLPSLAPTSLEVESAVPAPPPITFGPDSALALTLALVLVAAAASFMFRRRGP